MTGAKTKQKTEWGMNEAENEDNLFFFSTFLFCFVLFRLDHLGYNLWLVQKSETRTGYRDNMSPVFIGSLLNIESG